jgi:hypothetical protein
MTLKDEIIRNADLSNGLMHEVTRLEAALTALLGDLPPEKNTSEATDPVRSSLHSDLERTNITIASGLSRLNALLSALEEQVGTSAQPEEAPKLNVARAFGKTSALGDRQKSYIDQVGYNATERQVEKTASDALTAALGGAA